MKLIAQRMLDGAAQVDDAIMAAPKRTGVEDTVHTFKWNDGVQAGSVVIETAPARDYAGQWALLETITFDNAVPAPKIEVVRIEGAYPVFRHRVSEIVEGGTVSSRIDGGGA